MTGIDLLKSDQFRSNHLLNRFHKKTGRAGANTTNHTSNHLYRSIFKGTVHEFFETLQKIPAELEGTYI